MQPKGPNTMSLSKNILLTALAVGLLLLIPLAAKQFGGLNWSAFDFLAAGVLLFGAGLAFALVTHQRASWVYRAAAALAVGAVLLLLWVNLAVGIIGSEDNPANALYLGVLVVLVTGSILARLRARQMAKALFATALAQVVVTALALLFASDMQPVQVILVNAFFAALWCWSALLFLQADPAQA